MAENCLNFALYLWQRRRCRLDETFLCVHYTIVAVNEVNRLDWVAKSTRLKSLVN